MTSGYTFIFDFDGTLADSFKAAHWLFNKLAPRFGYHPVAENEVEIMRRKTAWEFLAARGVSMLVLPILAMQARHEFTKHVPDIPPVSGMTEVLPILHNQGHALGILTSNARKNVEAFLRHHNLQDFFDFVFSSKDLFGKDRRVKALIRKYKLDPERLIYVGDTDADIHAAQKAGIRMAAVTWGFQDRQVLSVLQPTWLLDHPSQLAGILPSAPSAS